MSRIALTIVVASVVLGAGTAHAKQTPEQKCQAGRYKVKGTYLACQQKAAEKLHGGGNISAYHTAVGKCMAKYTAAWPKLQKKAAGTGATCDAARFVDNLDGTVTDKLTGLQWEKKTDDATIHDKDNVYKWSGSPVDSAADGTAFTAFLAALNWPTCFAGQCDWRLPTSAELQTILLAPYPSCATSPCIDESVFGPTVAFIYESATTYASAPLLVWDVYFANGIVDNSYKDTDNYVRAVRSGL